MSLELAGQIVGIFVTISAIVGNQMPKRWQIMIGLAITNFLSVINTFLVGTGISVTLLCVVAVCNSLVNAYKSKKGLDNTTLEKIVFSILYLVAWGMGFYLSYIGGKANWLELLPLAGTVFFILSMIVPKERDITTLRYFLRKTASWRSVRVCIPTSSLRPAGTPSARP